MGRRSIRLGGYDYSYPGAYFVTVCAARRGLLFGWISDGRVVENANASIVRDCWLDLPNHYPHISLDAFVVMPDHIHGIVILLDTFEVGAGGFQTRPLNPHPYNPNRSSEFRTERR
jgi:putative transposase